jgi:hypothetical protein
MGSPEKRTCVQCGVVFETIVNVDTCTPCLIKPRARAIIAQKKEAPTPATKEEVVVVPKNESGMCVECGKPTGGGPMKQRCDACIKSKAAKDALARYHEKHKAAGKRKVAKTPAAAPTTKPVRSEKASTEKDPAVFVEIKNTLSLDQALRASAAMLRSGASLVSFGMDGLLVSVSRAA